jgi:hypothetical protein
MHGEVERLESLVTQTGIDLDEVRADRDLSDTGRVKKLQAVAIAAITRIERNAFAAAESAASEYLDELDRAISGVQLRTDDPPELASEIRAFIRSEKLPEDFVMRHLRDASVVSAVVSAPAFLSGLNDEAQGRVSAAAMAAGAGDEIAERALIEQALAQAHKGAENATRLIAAAGQVQSIPTPNGGHTWQARGALAAVA